MAADITLLFKASVKTVKTRNKALGLIDSASRDEPSCARRNTRQRNGFSCKAKEVISNISKLKDFLLQHRKDYVNAGSFMSPDVSHMTDNERDQIDQDAQTFMRTCADAIGQLRSEKDRQVVSAQVKDHRAAVLDLIEVYLKGVCKLYSEQRAVRVKRVVDKKRLSRLEPETPCKDKPQTDVEDNNDKSVSDSNVDLWEDSRVEDDLSPEEIQMFEQENQRLVGEMNSLLDEVRHIEGKVVEISRLQEIFTEKVLQQDTEIDNIHQLVVGATENVCVRVCFILNFALQNATALRVWQLYGLSPACVSLWFLSCVTS
ncbi:Syntaxin-18 [Triplophysa tibetana]|uniref:Syntaxin-18 n=1 Tax=Triplophysa tibetana TaxID=1572043 RepID=A0A5A9NLJ4_9TELE|nr:Syntaxin-18 [Triplophysa tibetana]